MFVVKIDYAPSDGKDFSLWGPFSTYEEAERFLDDQLHNMVPGYLGDVYKLQHPRD